MIPYFCSCAYCFNFMIIYPNLTLLFIVLVHLYVFSSYLS